MAYREVLTHPQLRTPAFELSIGTGVKATEHYLVSTQPYPTYPEKKTLQVNQSQALHRVS